MGLDLGLKLLDEVQQLLVGLALLFNLNLLLLAEPAQAPSSPILLNPKTRLELKLTSATVGLSEVLRGFGAATLLRLELVLDALQVLLELQHGLGAALQGRLLRLLDLGLHVLNRLGGLALRSA